MKKLFICVLAVILAVAACNKDSVPAQGGQGDREKVKDKVYIAGSLPTTVDKALRMNLGTVTTNPDEAGIIVLKSSDLPSRSDIVREAWEQGKIILEVSPDRSLHSDFWTSAGGPAILVADPKSESLLMVAIHEFECYCLQDPFVLRGYLSDIEIGDDEKASEAGASDNWKDQDSDPADFDNDVEYLSSHLASLVAWLNENTVEESNDSEGSKTAEYISELSEYIEDSKYSQIYEKQFSIGVDDYKICKIASSKPDCVTRHSDVAVKFTITPLYVYEENGTQSEDYYFVTATVVSYNGPMFGTYKKKHGAIPTYAHAMYCEDVKWSAELVADSGYDVSFYKSPMPSTTQGSTDYTASFSAGLNVTGQGGIAGGNKTGNLTVGGSFVWNKSTKKSMSDQMVMRNSSLTGSVTYDYMCLNFIKDNDVNKAVPMIARSDQECLASWCWKVSGTKDSEKKAFKFRFTLDPTFGFMYRHATWGAEGHLRHDVHVLPESERITIFNLTPPDRTPYGVIELKSTDTRYVGNVVVFDSNGKSKDFSKSAFSEGEIVRFQLPVGVYAVEYDIKDGNTGKVYERRRIDTAEILTGRTTHFDSYEGTEVTN